jgi:hypothetical protein
MTALRWSQSLRIALLTGLIFAVHPVHVEAVAALGFRKDLLAMLFTLLVVHFWQSSGRTWVRVLGAGACLVLGLLSKEAAVIGVIPFLLVADLVLHRQSEPFVQRFRHVAWRLTPLIAIGAVATLLLGGLLGGTLHAPTEDGGFLSRFQPTGIQQITEGRLSSYSAVVATTAASFPDVLRLLLFPLRLSIDYALEVPGAQRQAAAVLGGILFLGIAVLGVVLLRRGALVAGLAIAWFVLLFVPVSNLVPLTHFFLADRYLFAPSLGACLLLACGLEQLWVLTDHRGLWTRILPLSLTVLLLGAGAWRCIERNRDWRDDLSLWSSAIAQGDATYRSHYNVGAVLLGRNQYEQAEAAFEKALQIYPRSPDAHRGLAQLMLRQERLQEAASHMQAVLQEAPDDLPLRLQFAETLQRLGQLPEAIRHYERARLGIVEANRRGMPTPVSAQALQARIQQLRQAVP